MDLIDIVRKAAADNREALDLRAKVSITLDANSSVRNLLPVVRQFQEAAKGEKPEEVDGTALIRRVSGWQITNVDEQLMQEETAVVNDLKNKLKNPKDLTQHEFLGLLNPFLHKLQDHIGVSQDADGNTTISLLSKLGRYLGRDIVNTITQCCVTLTFWKPLECLLPHGLISWNMCGELIEKLADSRRGDLLCLCVKHMHDIRPSDLLRILRYFLDGPHDRTMAVVKREWKTEALLGIDIASKMHLRYLQKKSRQQTDRDDQLWVSKVTSVLLAMAVDDFSAADVCLHYVLSSSPDEIALSSVICRLDTQEVLKLLQYLGKWLRKYSVQHVTGPPLLGVKQGIKACKWVPSLDVILQWVNLVLDEHYSTLVLCFEFHDELKSLKKFVASFADIVLVSCSLASVVQHLRSAARLPNINRLSTDTDHFIEFLDIS